MRIGIDFDNTIVCYDGVFYHAAKERSSLPPDIGCTKDCIRDYYRSIGEEPVWTELQGYVYGALMQLAQPFPLVDAFFQACTNAKAEICIVSHKTLYPYKGPQYNLHTAARNWLAAHPFSKSVTAFFELTLKEKLNRIQTTGCDCFIDDLPELLLEPAFRETSKKSSSIPPIDIRPIPAI